MGWLGTRLRKKPSDEEVVEEELEPEPPSGPPLVLLVPEIAGGSSYRLHRFHDVDQAIEVIESTIPAIRAGIHAFWAMQERPLDSTDMDPRGEGMVLIRTSAESDVVYVVSFVDIESGESFARFEVKRGLDVGLVMIYWAAHVEIDQTGAGFTLSPSEPPPTANSAPRTLRDWSGRAQVATPGAVVAPPLEAPVADPEPAVEISDSAAVVEPPLPADTRDRREAAQAHDRYRHDEADAAGMIEEETDEPPAVIDLSAVVAANLNGKNGQAPEAAPETPVIEDVEPAVGEEIDPAEPEPVVAYQGDEEIAERILQEALGDNPIDLMASESVAGAEARTKDGIQPETVAEPPIPAREAEPEPELDLFNGPLKSPRSRKKPEREPEPEIAAAMTPEPEPDAPAPIIESLATPEPQLEAIAQEASIAEAEPPSPLEAKLEDAPIAPEAAVPAAAEVAPITEPPVFTPEPEPGVVAPESEPQPVFRPAEPAPERPSVFLPREEPYTPPAPAASSDGEPAEEDAVAQVEKILRIPRWEKREDPFKGFNSPPGRF
jgi:hypothetical protein